MPVVEWRKFPNIKKLIDRIDRHRNSCNRWKIHKPCFDCHFDTIGKIEQELEEYSWVDQYSIDLKNICMEFEIDLL